MKKIVLNIEGMTCAACSNGLEKYLKKQNGIINVNVNLVMATAMIEYEEGLKIDDIERYIDEAGFKSVGEEKKEKENKSELKVLIIYVILGIILMYISMGHMLRLPIPRILNMSEEPIIYTIFLLILATFFIIYGRDIIKNGIRNIIHKMPNMDSLVGVGVVVNYLYSLWNAILAFGGDSTYVHHLYFEASSIIILFVKIGRYIDKKNKSKAIDAIKNLVTITPKTGTILRDEKEIIVNIDEIKKGDIVICKPGEKIAADGIIIEGKTHTDESFITGESKPVQKQIGSKVIAGSINYEGYIKYRAEKIGKDSSISSIVQMVIEATNIKAPISRLADKISGYFVPIIFIISIISFILNFIIKSDISQAITSLVSVLVVACPCALGLATPLAMVVSIGKCSKKGILIKSSETLEAINKIDTIVFDKTGTLTQGKMLIVDGKYSKQNLKIIQSLESKANHPIAKSICQQQKDFYEVTHFEEKSGFGIKGIVNGKIYFAGNRKYVEEQNIQNDLIELENEYSNKGESIVYLFDEEKVLAILGLADKVKPDMKNIIEKLYKLNKRIIMLTGDNRVTAEIIARELRIKEVISNVSPKDKLDKIKQLNQNKTCMMIGDGINDSPALKASTIGISVAGGTDISADSADIILLNDNMYLIYDTFNIGKKTIKIIKQNLFWALFYNICMIPLATGLSSIGLNPMVASLAMTLSSITVVINSLRLR